MITKLKKFLRPVYYKIWEDHVVRITSPGFMNGFRWIINKRFDRAYFKGYYEPEIVNFFARDVKDGSVFLDVGGHAGYFSYLFSRLSPSGRIITFEPNPENFRFIQKIIELNSISNIELIAKGVGRRTGTVKFQEGESSSTGRVSENGVMSISILAIDDILNQLDRVDYIKIDVEGFGGEVIRGAMRTIVKFKPCILMELHENCDEREVFGRLCELGYQFYNLNGETEVINNKTCRFYIAK